jgi:signal transduction histidine kinase
MKEIIVHMLEYARTPPTDMQPIDLNLALDEAMRVLIHPLRKSGLTVTRELPPDLPKVQGIMNMAVQVFVNIITNSFEAAGRNGSLVIAARAASPDRVLVTMTDSGPGIPEADLEAVFDPFFTTRPQGTGLGLAICRQIMRGFGGDIRAEKSESGGAIIIMEFVKFCRDEA